MMHKTPQTSTEKPSSTPWLSFSSEQALFDNNVRLIVGGEQMLTSCRSLPGLFLRVTDGV